MEPVVREAVIEPGGSTGWHYHHVEIAAVVLSGTLTRFLHDCSVEISSAGDSFTERAGPRHVHLGRNLGTEPVVIRMTYALPEGSPFALDATAPLCARRPGCCAERPQTSRRISPRTR